MGLILDAVTESAAILDAVEGLRAYADPKQAATNRPCVLVAPPRLDYLNGTYSGPQIGHRLICLSSHPSGTIEALRQLDELHGLVAGAVNVDLAEPGTYPLGEGETVPCYVLNVTT